MDPVLIEGEDFYINSENKFVFTSLYLSKRGTCCGNGCQNCPFDYINVDEPKRSKLLSLRNNDKKQFEK